MSSMAYFIVAFLIFIWIRICIFLGVLLDLDLYFIWKSSLNKSLYNHTGGGYVITPVNQGKKSLVKHMLAIDWKFWKLSLRLSSARSITARMLERLAGITLLLNRN